MGANPFVGLRPFREEERHLYYGRELETDYVETRSTMNQLTLMFARSGVGKSSFLTSRLIPHLSATGHVSYINEWGGKDPEDVVRGAMEEARARSKYPESSDLQFLILDQFEDVFKVSFDRRNLWECFAEIAAAEVDNLRLIVTMREEWLGAWDEVDQYVPDAYGSMVRLAPLTEEDLSDAIVKPINLEGSVRIDASLVPVLLRDLRQRNAFGLGAEYVEPGILQLVCQRLWNEAKASDTGQIDLALYERLGRANQITREFVWRHLRGSGQASIEFAPDQRLLWAGFTRHLSAAQGVKATVTSEVLARKLLLTDLGIAGPAMTAGKGMNLQRYLARPVEKRGAAPPALTAWVQSTLSVAHDCGFLKRHEGFASGDNNRFYELAHDSLDEIFRSFALDFERWVSRRVYFLLAALGVVFFILPYIAYLFLTNTLLKALLIILGSAIALALYMGLVWVLLKIMGLIARVIYYPIVRRLVSAPVGESYTRP
jgi:hypothetical protein